MHPQSKHWHLIDYIIVRQRDPRDVLHTKVMPSTECHTDHRLVRCRLKLQLKPKPRNLNARKKKINIKSLQVPETKADFQENLQNRLNNMQNLADSSPDSLFSTEVLGFTTKRAETGLMKTTRRYKDY